MVSPKIMKSNKTDFHRLLHLLLWCCGIGAHAQTRTLLDPPVIKSANGVLNTSLTLEPAAHTIANSFITMNTRLFNGIYPGPTFRLKPGDQFNVDFSNNLVDQGISYEHNRLSAPDETNLHFHGLHVSGELPSDDATYVIGPGESFNYSTTLPEDHMPGTHWLHPHRHGATTLQVGGGAVSAIIVEDAPGTLPPQVETAREVLVVGHLIHFDELQRVAAESSDGLFSFSEYRDELNSLFGALVGSIVTINGQLNPVIPVNPGEWIRMRVIWASWTERTFDFSIPDCEMQLLAKDGIYIRDFPRPIEVAPLVAGGRADIMVRCLEVSTTFHINGAGGTIATIETSDGPVLPRAALHNWTPVYSGYTSDLREATASDGCSCNTQLGDLSVNGYKYTEGVVMHETYLGSIVERNIRAWDHPYHQHVYPYQIVSGFHDNSGYYAIGDWHDSIPGHGVVRFQPTIFAGKMMVHCHQLDHEDEGMMAIEVVNPTSTQPCVCTSVLGLATWAIIVICVGGVLLLVVSIFFLVRYLKARKNHLADISEKIEDKI